MELNFATTTLPTILLWGIGLALFAIGGFVGYLNMNMDARKKMEASDAKIEAIRTEAERKTKEAEKKLEEAKQLGAQAASNLLRLHKEENRVVVEMDGKPLSSTLSVDEKKRLIDLISHVRPFIEGASVQPTSIKSAVSQASQTPPLPASPIVNEIKPVPVTLIPSGAPVKKLDPEKEFLLLSIVQQIDTVLQKKLIGTPLEGQGIRLQESLQGAVEVYVGLQKYEAIDDVKDDNVKNIIRAAITEWETKYAPGPK
jgi:hypothetical protein